MNAFWLTARVIRQSDPEGLTEARNAVRNIREVGKRARILRSHFASDNGIPYFRVQWWYEVPDYTGNPQPPPGSHPASCEGCG